MAGKKISSEQLAGNTDVLNELLNPVQTSKTESEKIHEVLTTTTEVHQTPKSESEKPVHLTMLVKESTRKAWKQFFIEHDLNTTQGIEIAMLHLMSDVQNGKFKLNKGGLQEILVQV